MHFLPNGFLIWRWGCHCGDVELSDDNNNIETYL
jgi:hypothetical protein